MYVTNLSEIGKTLYQIAYHSRGNPRPPCGKSWESVLSPVGQSKWTDNIEHSYLIKVKVAARVAAIYTLVYTTNSHATYS